MTQTPDKLNEELGRILQNYKEYVMGVYQGVADYDEEVAKATITTAYAEAGYMTGEEWYRRFEKNFLNAEFTSDSLGYIDAEEVKEKVLDAAKRASGLLPNGKDERSAE